MLSMHNMFWLVIKHKLPFIIAYKQLYDFPYGRVFKQ
jgi:hypothetical protein